MEKNIDLKNLSYMCGSVLHINVTNIGELKQLLDDVQIKEKALQEAVHKLSAFYLEMSFTIDE